MTVEQYHSQQIFVMGEVKQPGSLQFTGAMTLIEALARVGSTTDRAGAEAMIVRSTGEPATAAQSPNGSNAETIRVDLQSLQTGALSQNVALRAGDTISSRGRRRCSSPGRSRPPASTRCAPG